MQGAVKMRHIRNIRTISGTTAPPLAHDKQVDRRIALIYSPVSSCIDEAESPGLSDVSILASIAHLETFILSGFIMVK